MLPVYTALFYAILGAASFVLNDPELSKQFKALPRFLFVAGIRCADKTTPLSGGGHADIFKGHCNSQKVALKRLRIFARESQRPAVHQVSIHPSFEPRRFGPHEA